MTIVLGNLSLCAAVLVAMSSIVLSMISIRFGSTGALRLAKFAILAFAGLITVASGALMSALIHTDFHIEYVSHYTERALPFGYKLAAFWAGQEGSLLLWGLLLGLLSAIAVFTQRTQNNRERAGTIITLAVVCGFFAALLLFAANPFKESEVVPMDGRGLNPMLQDPGMIAHPPMLFLGYAGYTIPFALMIGALVTGRKDNGWLTQVRWWAVASFLFLSVGILLGAQWAYVELGWGGYWAWDPVENASLLPWLTGTALMHSIMVQQTRGMLKLWNAGLIAVTFILCIFGTYITRSGVVQSVHSFGESLIGTFFLAFLVLSILSSIVVILIRRRLLAPEHEMETFAGREGAFLLTNILLSLMTLVTLVGTIFPLISGIFLKEGISVSKNFYNTSVAPLSLVLAALMAVGPVLIYGKTATAHLTKKLLVPVIVAGLIVIGFAAWGLHNIYALVAVAITSLAGVNIVVETIHAAIARAESHGENRIIATLRLLDSNHRRYGGQLTHVGVLMIIAGVTGSSLFNRQQTFEMKPHDTAVMGNYTLTMHGLDEIREVNYSAVQAKVLFTSADGKTDVLLPQRRFYDKSEESSADVAIRSNWREDLYVTLAGWEANGSIVTIQALINPLVSWIWIGGIVMTIGALICLTPRFGALIPAMGNSEPSAVSSKLTRAQQLEIPQ